MSYARFTAGIGMRAAAIALAVFAAIQLFLIYRLAAAAVMMGVIAVLLVINLARYISQGDRLIERFIDCLAAGEFEHLSSAEINHGFHRLKSAIERAHANFNTLKHTQQQTIDYLQTLIDTVSVALFVIQADGKICVANRAARKLAGASATRVTEADVFGKEAASELAALLPGERRIVRLSNAQRVLVSTARFSAAGVQHQVFAVQDVASELDAVELKAWRDLVRILAHEMMSSLTPISSLAQSLKHYFEGPTTQGGEGIAVKDIAAGIDAIARRSVGLMNFVERYRKMAELPRVQIRQVELDELIRRIELLMQATLQEKQIAYSSHVSPECTVLFADVELLEQALINIIRNAVDALTDAKQPQISIICSLQDDHIAIAVSDNGPGVDPAYLDRIFVPFFTSKPNGSGIGLSLARQIALAHGGRIDVATNPPHGAIFTLLLPTGKHSPLLE